MKRIAIVALLSLVALGIAGYALPGRWSVLVRAELLILCGCGLIGVTRLVDLAAPKPARTALDLTRPAKPPRPVAPASLVTLNRRLLLASRHAGDAHHWVRPMVRAIAADRLELRRGLDLDRPDDPRVAALLGPVAYRLAQPRPKRPPDPLGPGISPEDLEAAIAGLEAL